MRMAIISAVETYGLQTTVLVGAMTVVFCAWLFGPKTKKKEGDE
jgi:hypothetical protein